jgi:erythromycin esterase-like protein
VNRYVRGAGEDRCAESALKGFERFPAWLWRNRDVLQFVGWLRRHNDVLAPGAAPRAGFYALDLHGPFDSLRPIDATDPPPGADPDELFCAEQSARLAKHAEEYYRLSHGRVSPWNLREQHMAQTLEALALHLAGKVVVWAHNSHVGDARATELGEQGELSFGQLVRERYPGKSALVGMTTYRGSVTAASGWESPAGRRRVREALPGSHEERLHRVGLASFFVPAAALDERRLERAIGAVYHPETERASHYYHADMSRQYDALLHFDETRALEPLDVGGTASHSRGKHALPAAFHSVAPRG